MNIWDILGVLAIICLIPTFFFIGRSRKPIWGGLIYGLVIAAVVSVIKLEVNWELLKKISTVSVLIGTGFWLLDLSLMKSKKKKKKTPVKAKISN